MSAIPALSSAAPASDPTAPSPRLVNAAHEFEAQMMKELLKPMTGGDALTNDGDEDQGSGGALGEFASEALGRALSDRGGFGIATSIVKELSLPANHSLPAGVSRFGNNSLRMQVTGNRHTDTVIKPAE
jgi:Rod binding domain-containing protein